MFAVFFSYTLHWIWVSNVHVQQVKNFRRQKRPPMLSNPFPFPYLPVESCRRRHRRKYIWGSDMADTVIALLTAHKRVYIPVTYHIISSYHLNGVYNSDWNVYSVLQSELTVFYSILSGFVYSTRISTLNLHILQNLQISISFLCHIGENIKELEIRTYM